MPARNGRSGMPWRLAARRLWSPRLASRFLGGKFMRNPWRFLVLGIITALLASFGWTQSSGSASSQKQSVDAIKLPFDQGSSAVWQSLRKLQTRSSILMITGHPDEEDGGMLTYYSRGKGARVSLLALNRGEGGQNVMGHDYYDALGQARTQELLAA